MKGVQGKVCKLLKLFLTICVVFVISIVFIKVDASTTDIDIHLKTKVFSSNNCDYYNGCEDYENYRNIPPSITVLTHGLGGRYYHWSNNSIVNSGDTFAYNSDSIVEKLYQYLNGNMTIYIAEADSNITYNQSNLM